MAHLTWKTPDSTGFLISRLISLPETRPKLWSCSMAKPSSCTRSEQPEQQQLFRPPCMQTMSIRAWRRCFIKSLTCQSLHDSTMTAKLEKTAADWYIIHLTSLIQLPIMSPFSVIANEWNKSRTLSYCCGSAVWVCGHGNPHHRCSQLPSDRGSDNTAAKPQSNHLTSHESHLMFCHS